MTDPEVYGKGDQQGPLWGTNLRGALIAGDCKDCVDCGARQDVKVDHALAKKRGGSGRTRYRIAKCGTCKRAKGEAALRV